MSSKENNSEVAVDKATENSDKAGGDAKAEVKGMKRPSELSLTVVKIQTNLMSKIGTETIYKQNHDSEANRCRDTSEDVSEFESNAKMTSSTMMHY